MTDLPHNRQLRIFIDEREVFRTHVPSSILDPGFGQSSAEPSDNPPPTSNSTLGYSVDSKNEATLKAVFLFLCLTNPEYFFSESIKTCVRKLKQLLTAPLSPDSVPHRRVLKTIASVKRRNPDLVAREPKLQEIAYSIGGTVAIVALALADSLDLSRRHDLLRQLDETPPDNLTPALRVAFLAVHESFQDYVKAKVTNDQISGQYTSSVLQRLLANKYISAIKLDEAGFTLIRKRPATKDVTTDPASKSRQGKQRKRANKSMSSIPALSLAS